MDHEGQSVNCVEGIRERLVDLAPPGDSPGSIGIGRPWRVWFLQIARIGFDTDFYVIS